ncbi:GGDEF domain-containing protein [Pseudomonas huanghezhanensis]|uniref:GGDEF domain-containing protein n=1 Tax=Pseudomonas huanghezhanensis TaxID=3002903 RepID=UPI00228698D4|nr:GGDEF domain-containing protein [Pseudomonas sp. BSw22131]
MFDIDHFKRVNDTFGHQCGDRVIQRVADIIREHIRDADIAGRYGGEAFAMLLPDSDKHGGAMLAERLRISVQALEIQHEGQTVRCTISFGVADLYLPLDDHKALIESADQGLYASKKNGRNQVSVYEPL